MECISEDHQEGTMAVSRAGRESQDMCRGMPTS